MKKIDQRFRISNLIAKRYSSVISDDDDGELDDWINESEANIIEYELIADALIDDSQQLFYDDLNIDQEWKFFQKNKIKSVHRLRVRIIKYAAAIILPLILGGLFFNIYDFKTDDSKIIASSFDFSPGGPSGFLELTNGEKIALNKEKRDTIIEHRRILRLNNTILCDYNKISVANREINYNILKVPKRGEYSLVLSDGTKVKLNSDTQLRFPVSFTGNYREVYLKGEAFFEVTKNKSKPFIVHVNDVSIEVLGTSFNIEGRGSEREIKATLLEGSVRISHKTESVLIKPSQQAIYNYADSKISVKDVDVRAYIAWKNGMFYFDNERLDIILEKLSLWYGTEIFYINPSLKELRFSIEVKRYEKMTRILDMLEKTGKLKFDSNKNTIIVYK